ncbi:MAG: shikimate dehydrogenase [Nitrospirota bacterium]
MKITGKTKIVGIFGHPVHHTFSPLMQNAAFNAAGLDYCYLPFDVKPENLKLALNAIPLLNIKGLNITIPHKEKVLSYLDEVTDEAKFIGAVNTIKTDGEKLTGHNTDGRGFTMAFQEEFSATVEGKRFLIIGAGGAAKAIAIQLAIEGARAIIIANRTFFTGRELAEHLLEHFPNCDISIIRLKRKEISNVMEHIDVLINTTPVGMKPDDPLLITDEMFNPDSVVCDIVYNPKETILLRRAKESGLKTMSGIGMLLHQGALAFEIWTGEKPPLSVMREELEKAL